MVASLFHYTVDGRALSRHDTHEPRLRRHQWYVYACACVRVCVCVQQIKLYFTNKPQFNALCLLNQIIVSFFCNATMPSSEVNNWLESPVRLLRNSTGPWQPQNVCSNNRNFNRFVCFMLVCMTMCDHSMITTKLLPYNNNKLHKIHSCKLQ